jgi:hypothetical protein
MTIIPGNFYFLCYRGRKGTFSRERYFVQLSLRAASKDKAQPRQIGDYCEPYQKDDDEGKRGHIERQYRFFKTDTGDEQVDSQWRDRGTDFKVGEEDNPEVKRVNSVGLSNGGDERDNHGQCGKHTH